MNIIHLCYINGSIVKTSNLTIILTFIINYTDSRPGTALRQPAPSTPVQPARQAIVAQSQQGRIGTVHRLGHTLHTPQTGRQSALRLCGHRRFPADAAAGQPGHLRWLHVPAAGAAAGARVPRQVARDRWRCVDAGAGRSEFVAVPAQAARLSGAHQFDSSSIGAARCVRGQ